MNPQNSPQNNKGWYEGIWDDNTTQVVRVFRPREVLTLLENIDIEDETGDKSRKWLRKESRNLSTNDIREWLHFLLYSGCRFSEAVMIHDHPNLLRTSGNIRLPNVPGGKEMRTIKARNIYLSNYGRENIQKFFDAKSLPTNGKPEVDQTLTSLTLIMHKAGERIGLPEETFTKVIKEKEKDPQTGEYVTYEAVIRDKHTHKERTVLRYKKITKPYIITTNACMVRSMRKTWESWLFKYYSGKYGPDMRDDIYLSQGHTKRTAAQHYINLADFTPEDLQDIERLVKGYGEVE